jgi:hypothetical protein
MIFTISPGQWSQSLRGLRTSERGRGLQSLPFGVNFHRVAEAHWQLRGGPQGFLKVLLALIMSVWLGALQERVGRGRRRWY